MPHSKSAPHAPETAERPTANIVLHPAPLQEAGAAAKAIAFVKKHPVMTVAGGIAIGVAVSALLPRKASRKALGRAFDLAKATGAATLLAGHEVAGKAEKLGYSAKRQAGIAAERAEEYGEKAADRVTALGLAALAAASAFGKSTASRAEHLGDAAAERSGRVIDLAGELRKRINRNTN